MTFPEFLRSKLDSPWVLHRRTKRIVERYGENVVCISRQRYNKLTAEYCSLMNRKSPYETEQSL